VVGGWGGGGGGGGLKLKKGVLNGRMHECAISMGKKTGKNKLRRGNRLQESEVGETAIAEHSRQNKAKASGFVRGGRQQLRQTRRTVTKRGTSEWEKEVGRSQGRCDELSKISFYLQG